MFNSAVEEDHFEEAAMTNENRVNESEKATPAAVEDWVPSKHVKLIIAAQAFVVFVVALDATILTTSLPVSTRSSML